MRNAGPRAGGVISIALPLLCVLARVEAQAVSAPPSAPLRPAPKEEQSVRGDDASRKNWLDRMQSGLYRTVWRSAMGLDRMFGAQLEDESAYQEVSGSISPALLWNQVEGFQPQLRFRANIPLPQLSDRFSAFVGRVNRDEYVTERDEESGAFRRQYGPVEDDQTLLGISYREPPREGGRFDAGVGVRIRLPLDPYIKGSYIYTRGTLEHTLFTFRETAFWQNSEDLGETTRMDLERVIHDKWLLRWTTSGTISQESQGIRGYSAITALRALSPRKALAFEVGFDGESENVVPLHDYGFKFAYRQQAYRDWLVLEYRTSLTWPKDSPTQDRRSSIGFGLGVEIMFGNQTFLARPTTF
jgi:hypothetical protein